MAFNAITNFCRSAYNKLHDYYYCTHQEQLKITVSLQMPEWVPRRDGMNQCEAMLKPRNVEKGSVSLLGKEGSDYSDVVGKTIDLEYNHKTQRRNVAKAIETFDFQNAPADSVLLNDDLPYLALDALEWEFLDQKYGALQMATILNFWGAYQYHGKNLKNLEMVPLFLGEVLNPLAENLMKQTFKTNYQGSPSTPFLEGSKFEAFLEIMRKLPLSEQRFLLVEDVQGDESLQEIVKRNDGDVFQASISQAIKDTSSFNVFSRVLHNDQEMRMVPSIGMMQAFLDAQYEEPVKITPRIYLSTEMQIRECGLTDTRDMMMPFPDRDGNNKCPKMADGFQAPWYDFSYHDFYHAAVASAVDKIYRKAGITAADALEVYAEKVAAPASQIKRQVPLKVDFVGMGICSVDEMVKRKMNLPEPNSEAKGIKQLAISFVDMEYTSFMHFRKTGSSEEAFWETILLKFGEHQIKVLSSQASPISEENQIEMFKHLYDIFVQQKKGPSKLDEENFKAAFKKINANLKNQLILRLGKELNL